MPFRRQTSWGLPSSFYQNTITKFVKRQQIFLTSIITEAVHIATTGRPESVGELPQGCISSETNFIYQKLIYQVTNRHLIKWHANQKKILKQCQAVSRRWHQLCGKLLKNNEFAERYQVSSHCLLGQGAIATSHPLSSRDGYARFFAPTLQWRKRTLWD